MQAGRGGSGSKPAAQARTRRTTSKELATTRAGTSPVNTVVRETIVKRQVHFQSSD